MTRSSAAVVAFCCCCIVAAYWVVHALMLGGPPARGLEEAALRAELELVRDSLRVERADLIRCYQTGGWLQMPRPEGWPQVRYRVGLSSSDSGRADTVVVWP